MKKRSLFTELLLAFILLAAPLTLFSCGASVTPPVSAFELFPDAKPGASGTAEPCPEPEITAPAQNTDILPELVFFLDDLSDSFIPITDYGNVWVWGRDIGCFGVLPRLSSSPDKKSYAAYWEKGLSEFPALADYRLGYRLDFTTWGGRVYSLTILDPKDTSGAWNEFIEVYLYDDIHQKEGVFYSHLLESEMTADTLITSVKLTGALEAGSLKTVAVSAFLYKDKTEFDASGSYTGKNIYTLNISEIG